MSDSLPILYPTVEGKVQGIICMDPFTLQCGECADIHCCGRKLSLCIQTCGWVFHVHEIRPGYSQPRRCRDCLAKVEADCSQCRANGRRR